MIETILLSSAILISVSILALIAFKWLNLKYASDSAVAKVSSAFEAKISDVRTQIEILSKQNQSKHKETVDQVNHELADLNKRITASESMRSVSVRNPLQRS